MKVLVTGASGFIGRALCARLSGERGIELTGTVRSSDRTAPPAGRIRTKDIGPDTRWDDVLDSVEVVVHTAARVHVKHGAGDLSAYRRVNVDGTANLARQAAACGVRRFVFLSSVKVNGDDTPPGQAFRAEDRPAPVDAYGISKHEAEVELSRLTREHGMEVVTIRPPLVYGPGAKANFLTLMRWVHRGYPLPFARVRNARSLIALDNLVDLVRLCCEHPAAANSTFMAADGEDVSTAELMTRIGAALDRPARLVPVPPKLLLALATVAGRRAQAGKLLGNLQVDARATRERLGWQPVVGMDQALAETARHFLEGRR
jgi:UDP-4-keto-D-QuiNAc 4-reductase